MLNKLSMKLRLVLVLAPLTIMLGVLGALALNALAKSSDALHTVYADHMTALSKLTEIDQLLARARGDASRPLVMADDNSQMAISIEKIDKKLSDIDGLFAEYLKTGIGEEEQHLADAFNQVWIKYRDQGLKLSLIALKAGDRAQVLDAYRNHVEPTYTASREALAELEAVQVHDSRAEYEKAERNYASTRNLFLALILGSVLYGAITGIVLVRNLTKELGGEPSYAREVARRIAAGDLATPVQVSSQHEGSLLHAIQGMQKDLTGIVGQIKSSSEAINSAASEIATGNTDLAARTEEQASSLEETAASMEELTTTMKQNAENAKQANQLARGAGDVAAKGGEVVAEVVQTMGAITDSSKKIVDIISVIDGIAFQTNILALNAAVEAARAGEQGRGFAVVASEVRTLAQRSAGAAKEIKQLISDSVEKVQSGSRQVENAGKTMNEIVQSVKRVTDIMGEITAASQEQSSGIEQVNQTVTQMDQVTQQNAALVEEAAASAKSLEEQADALTKSVSVFRIGGESSAAAHKPATAARIAVPHAPAPKKAAATAVAPAALVVAKAPAGSNGHAKGDNGQWMEF